MVEHSQDHRTKISVKFHCPLKLDSVPIGLCERTRERKIMKNYSNSHCTSLPFCFLSNFLFPTFLNSIQFFLSSTFAVDQAKHGCKSNRSDCARRKCSRRGTLTLQMEQLIGKFAVSQHLSYSVNVQLTCFTLFHP